MLPHVLVLAQRLLPLVFALQLQLPSRVARLGLCLLSLALAWHLSRNILPCNCVGPVVALRRVPL